MRKSAIILVSVLYLCTGAIAQTDLSGTWQGRLAISPNESMAIQFVFSKQTNGSYKVTLNSPNAGAIKNVLASGVKLNGSTLNIDVASLSGSYTGTVGKEAITGEWKQQGNSIPLVLTRYKEPPVSSLKPLLGEWVGEIAPPGGPKIATVFKFQISKDGKFTASTDIPEQGQTGIPVSDIRLEGDHVSASIASGAAEYNGKLVGDKIEGTLKQNGQEIKLNLVKGKYEPVGFAVPAESIKLLAGEWVGYTGPTKLSIVFRFETTRTGKLAVYMDVPDQRVRGVIVKDFAVSGDQLTIKLPGSQGDTYTGRVSGESMKGTFKLNNIDQELNLSKGKYRYGSEMPLADMQRLIGQWTGKVTVDGKTLTTIWKFEKSAEGRLQGDASSPEQGPQVLPITNIILKGDQLTLRIALAGGEYAGKLTGNSISGTYKVNGQEYSVNMTRGTAKQ